MKVSVLVKCPHDVRAEVQEVDATPLMSPDGNFAPSAVSVTFDCDICKGYHEGYRAAKQGQTVSGGPIVQTIRSEPTERASGMKDSRIAGSV